MSYDPSGPYSFSRFYPGKWINLPAKLTAITKAALDWWDQAFLDLTSRVEWIAANGSSGASPIIGRAVFQYLFDIEGAGLFVYATEFLGVGGDAGASVHFFRAPSKNGSVLLSQIVLANPDNGGWTGADTFFYHIHAYTDDLTQQYRWTTVAPLGGSPSGSDFDEALSVGSDLTMQSDGSITSASDGKLYNVIVHVSCASR